LPVHRDTFSTAKCSTAKCGAVDIIIKGAVPNFAIRDSWPDDWNS
jgi:hypothetical protein